MILEKIYSCFTAWVTSLQIYTHSGGLARSTLLHVDTRVIAFVLVKRNSQHTLSLFLPRQWIIYSSISMCKHIFGMQQAA